MRTALFLLCLCTLAACGSQERARVSPEEARAAFASADLERIEPVLKRLTAHDVDWLLEGFTHYDRGVREWSVRAIGDLAPQQSRVLAAVMEAFEDEDDWVRWQAARALGNLGPYAQKALPLLEPVANAEQELEVVRAAAKVAVKQIRGRD